ncbi:MAG: CpsD/CapB family tyrosine-protein kinase [Nitrospirae bacterium]|nr:CpsD/CapB family tyrosine-protein kinase [Candidatus Manganitrophaceae bacterium]
MTKRIIPEFEEEGREELVTLARQISLSSDRYRMLFARIDQLCRTPEKKMIALTSSVKGEGKTTTSANLAVVCARDFGRRCLIVDGDFKNPSVARAFGIAQEPGLIDVIEGKLQLGSALRKGPIENLAILPMGRRGKESNIWTTEEIKHVLTEVRAWFDYVWIDAPPILPLFDMSLISEAVDGIVLVVRAGEVPEQVLAQAVKSLGSAKLIGSVLNRAKMEWPSRYYEYGY